MNTCFVITHVRTGTYHTVQKDGKHAILGFATAAQARTFKKLANDIHGRKYQGWRGLPLIPLTPPDKFVAKKMATGTLCRNANLSCLDVLLMNEDHTYTLFPATCADTFDEGSFRYYLKNKYYM